MHNAKMYIDAFWGHVFGFRCNRLIFYKTVSPTVLLLLEVSVKVPSFEIW
jgi:hypothetical protein